MNCKLNLSFDGTAYHGWQAQNNAVSVCETVQNAIEKIFNEKTVLTGCSRTDAGVHALDFVCNFNCAGNIPAANIPLALNTALARDIRVTRAEYVDDSFNSRFSAHSKTYMYQTYCGKIISPFYRNYAYHFPYDVDIDKIKEATGFFEGTHDFSGFMTQGSSQKTTTRTVNFLRAKKEGELITFEINADAYLYNMVRIISGTLLYVGIGRIKPSEIPDIIKSLDRKRAGITAGAQGLFLKEVLY